jgi:hypothetical protein
MTSSMVLRMSEAVLPYMFHGIKSKIFNGLGCGCLTYGTFEQFLNAVLYVGRTDSKG